MSERTLVIHPGSHKTGSSAIQGYLFERREPLARAGVDYLHRDMANSSLWMLRAFKQDLSSLPAFKRAELDEADQAARRKLARRALTQLASQSRSPLAILSAESISTFTLEELLDLHQFTASLYDRVIIFQYFRPLKSRIESAYQERLKHRFASIDDRFPLDYNERVEMLDAVFDPDNVILHKYDSEAFPRGNVVRHFLAELGIEPAGDFPRQAMNAGLSQPAVGLLYIYRLAHPQRSPRDKAIVRELKQLPGPPFRFHSSRYRKLLWTRRNSVSMFEQRAGFSISENVTADDATGVADEGMLTAVSPATLAWLQERVSSLTGEFTPLPAPCDLDALGECIATLGSAP